MSSPPDHHPHTRSVTEKATLLAWYDEAGGDDWCCTRDEATEPWSNSTEPCGGDEQQGAAGSVTGSVETVGGDVGYEDSRWLGIKCVNSSVTEIDLSDCCVSGQ